jgi:hypothetical protein
MNPLFGHSKPKRRLPNCCDVLHVSPFLHRLVASAAVRLPASLPFVKPAAVTFCHWRAVNESTEEMLSDIRASRSRKTKGKPHDLTGRARAERAEDAQIRHDRRAEISQEENKDDDELRSSSHPEDGLPHGRPG